MHVVSTDNIKEEIRYKHYKIHNYKYKILFEVFEYLSYQVNIECFVEQLTVKYRNHTFLT